MAVSKTSGPGLVIGPLTLKNVVLFKDANVDFSKPGVTTVRGLNLHARGKNQTNAAGKSLLTSSICSVLQFGPPMAATRRDKRGLLTATAKATIEQTVTKDGHEYRLVQATHGKTVKYTIYKDGKDMKVRTTPLAESFINDLHGYNAAEWFSTVYLDGRRAFPLQMGTDSERLSFITDLFRLEENDRIRRLLNELKSGFKDDATRLSVIDADLIRVRRELKDIDWSKALAKRRAALKDEIAQTREQYEKLSARLEILNEVRAQSEIVNDLKARLDKIEKPPFGSSEIERYIRAHKAHELYDAEIAAYDKKLRRLKDEKQKLGTVDGIGKPKALLQEMRALEAEIGRLKVSHATLTRNQTEIEAALEDLRVRYRRLKHLDGAALPKNRKKRLAVLNEQIAEARTTLKLVKLAESGHDHCPTCGSAINSKTVAVLGKKAKRSIAEAEAEIEQLEQATELETVLAEGRKLREAKDEEAEGKIKAAARSLKKASARLAVVEALLEKAQAYESIEERLRDLLKHKPEPPILKRPKYSEKQLKSWAVSIELLTDTKSAYSQAVEKLARATRNFPSLADAQAAIGKIKSVSKAQTDANSKLYELTSELSTLNQKRGLHRSASARLAELEATRAKLGTSVDDLPVVEALIHAFGNKGIKVLLAQQIAQRLEHALNEVAPRVFVEPVKFRLKVEVNKFSIEYSMRKGRDVSPWADVRVLSGSESKSFVLACVAALLPLLPSDKRTNLMVLDEMDSTMSEPTQILFATEFLPYLKKLVPTIFVVTPQIRIHYPGRQMLVTKKNGVSTLSELRPDMHELSKRSKRK